MRVIVWKEGEWLPSKVGDGMNKHVIFKTIPEVEGEKPKEVRLNITDTESFFNGQTVKEVWEPLCKEGNVLDVTLMNERNVNKFTPPAIKQVKPKNEGAINHASDES